MPGVTGGDGVNTNIDFRSPTRVINTSMRRRGSDLRIQWTLTGSLPTLDLYLVAHCEPKWRSAGSEATLQIDLSMGCACSRRWRNPYFGYCPTKTFRYLHVGPRSPLTIRPSAARPAD